MKVDHVEAGGGSPPSGLPPQYKPLEVLNGWAPETVAQVAPNIRYSATLGLPQIVMSPHIRGGKCVIVGSAPSVMDHIEQIRELRKDPANSLWVVNKSYRLMLDHGIVPTAHCLMEIAPRAYDCLEDPHPALTYYVASLCANHMFDQLRGRKVIVWHCHSDQWEHVKAYNEAYGTMDNGVAKTPMFVGGGFTTFLRTLSVSWILGWRDYELFGVDSSFPEGRGSHFFGTPDYGGDVCDCHAQTGPGDQLRHYWSKPYLIRQAHEFREFCEHHHQSFKMRVHGPGLLPDIHRKIQPLMYED